MTVYTYAEVAVAVSSEAKPISLESSRRHDAVTHCSTRHVAFWLSSSASVHTQHYGKTVLANLICGVDAADGPSSASLCASAAKYSYF